MTPVRQKFSERSDWCSIKHSGYINSRVTPLQKVFLGVVLADSNATHTKVEPYTYRVQYTNKNSDLLQLFGECLDHAGEIEKVGNNLYRWTSPKLVEGENKLTKRLLLDIPSDILDEYSEFLNRLIYGMYGGFEEGKIKRRWFLKPDTSTITRDEWVHIMKKFAPMWISIGDEEKLMISDGNAFSEEIGIVPLSGCQDAWPETEYQTEALSVTCPFCQEDYTHICLHWKSSVSCNPPVLDGSLQGLLTAMILSGSEVLSTGPGIILRKSHSSKQLLEFFRIELGALANRITENDGECTLETHYIYDEDIIRLAERYNGDVQDYDREGIYNDVMSLHVYLLRLLYALCGETHSDKVLLNVPKKVAKDPQFLDMLRIHQPEVTDRGVLIDRISCISMIGIVPIVGAEEDWPATYT